jgi:hypothetical protein
MAEQRPGDAAHAMPDGSPREHAFSTSPYCLEEREMNQHPQYSSDDADLDRLGPLPPPPPEIPPPPPHTSITWTYDPASRVYLGDFSSVSSIPRDQKNFVAFLLERNDITVICEGLYDPVTDVKPFLRALGDHFGDVPYDQFRHFTRRSSQDTGFTEYEEEDGYLVLDVKTEYFNYLARYVYGAHDFDSCTFDLQKPVKTTGKTNKSNSVDNNLNQCIYMTDVAMREHFPEFDQKYKDAFKMKDFLPAGNSCLMKQVRMVLPYTMH